MIKVKTPDKKIEYFENKKDFGEWLVKNEFARNIRDFANEEYDAWEVASGTYNLNDIYKHYWEDEILDIINGWIELGCAEEIDMIKKQTYYVTMTYLNTIEAESYEEAEQITEEMIREGKIVPNDIETEPAKR